MFGEEEEQNTFVDVCGDNEEENKENAGHFGGAKNAPSNFGFIRKNFGGQISDRVLTSSNQLEIQKTPQMALTFSSTSNSKTENYPSSMQHENSDNDENDGIGGNQDENSIPSKKSTVVSRKEKSLGKLCGPFLVRVGQEASAGRDVHLETIARNMRVEKRRIYDIVNVMEALEVMQKTNKSFYKWHGLGQLPMLMHVLQSEAQRGKLPKRIAEAEGAMCKFAEFSDANKVAENVQNLPSNGEEKQPGMKATNSMEICPIEGAAALEEDPAFGEMASRDRCGKNSLAQLCRRFLMVLLCNPHRRRVSLDVVSTLLINDPADTANAFEPPSRSRCRRLYDIANVLVEMRLVQKRNSMFGTKKIPLFEYCGPEPDANPINAEQRMQEFQQRSGLAISIFNKHAQTDSTIRPGNGEIGNDENGPSGEMSNGTETMTGMKRKREMLEEKPSGSIHSSDNNLLLAGISTVEKNQPQLVPTNSKNIGPNKEKNVKEIVKKNETIKMEPKESENCPPAAKKPRRILGEKQLNHQKSQNEPQILPRPQPLLPYFLHPNPNVPPTPPLPSPAPSLPFSSIPLLRFGPPPPFPSAAQFWPSSSHQNLAFAAAQQLVAAYSTGTLPPPISPIPQIPPISANPPVISSQSAKVRHSVQSIIGCSQKENIAAGNGSPHAFKPPPSSSQQNFPKGTTANRALPFGQKHQNVIGNERK